MPWPKLSVTFIRFSRHRRIHEPELIGDDSDDEDEDDEGRPEEGELIRTRRDMDSSESEDEGEELDEEVRTGLVDPQSGRGLQDITGGHIGQQIWCW